MEGALDGGGGFGVAVLRVLPAEDVVVLAEHPQDGALGGAALGEREVAEQALVAAGDLAGQLLLLLGGGGARPQVRVAQAAAADAELADVQRRDLLLLQPQRADQDVLPEVLLVL